MYEFMTKTKPQILEQFSILTSVEHKGWEDFGRSF